jgi:ABC-2 type transport system permease protein
MSDTLQARVRVDAALAAVDGMPDAPAKCTLWASTLTLLSRATRLSLRNPEGLTTALVLPVMLMLMFVFLFGGAIHTGTRYVNFVVPGVLLICVGFGSGLTAVTVATDLSTGVFDRFRAMDVSARGVINGHVVASVVRNVVSTILVFAVALAIGYRSHADIGAWLVATGVLVLFMLSLAWLAAAIGVLAKSPEAANGVMFMVAFLPYASSAFVPVSTMPGWLQAFARNQPVTQVVDVVRGELMGTSLQGQLGAAVLWSVAIATVSAALAGVLFARRSG